MDTSSTPVCQPNKIPKRNEEFGNFMMSLLEDSDLVDTDNDNIINIETLGMLSTLEEEVKFYKGLPNVDINTKFNLLSWWGEKGVKFHKLYRIWLPLNSNIASSSRLSNCSVQRAGYILGTEQILARIDWKLFS